MSRLHITEKKKTKQNKTPKQLQENRVIVTEQELCFELSENEGKFIHEKHKLRKTKLGPSTAF